MDPEILVSERVEVVAVYRSQAPLAQLCVPVRMRYRGREITFTEVGLRHPTSKGQRMIHVFDMTDGTTDYRLEFDAAGLTWTVTKVLEVQ